MDSEREYDAGRVPLAGFDAAEPGRDAPGGGRRAGLRHARRMSNWTAAALLVGTGAATVALARGTLAITPPAAVPAAAAGTAATAGAAAGQSTAGGPAVAHSVATTSGSGVTTTTTTRVVNGKTIVSRVRHAPAYHDN
ncbi:MAG: hypothetical protein ACLQDY_20400 [Streptosporangiaceae bacterium]